MDKFLGIFKKILPTTLYNKLNPAYHWSWAFFSALFYGFPSKKIRVIGVTGTKGKSSTVEILNSIFEAAGYKTALSNTIRFKVGDKSWDNLFKMSMPGRFFLQKLLRQAVSAGCQYFFIEMTSQGAITYRHRFIELDALIFTNLSPEHIEAHGSYENYRDAKLSIAKNMSRFGKISTIIANVDEPESKAFLDCDVQNKVEFSLHDLEPYVIKSEGLEFTLNGRRVHSQLSGLFNLSNIAAAIAGAKSQKLIDNDIIAGIGKLRSIPGRVQKLTPKNSKFSVFVDYAHTPDSLEKFYRVFAGKNNICILGGTGGGRDTWKRAEMGRIADNHCDQIILTDEDPYDEDPNKIVEEVAKGITKKAPKIIMDRRLAIREAISMAREGSKILLTGKGTDPYIMQANGKKLPWSDAKVVQEEIEYFEQTK